MADTTTTTTEAPALEPVPFERNQPFTNRVMDDDFVKRFNDAFTKDKAPAVAAAEPAAAPDKPVSPPAETKPAAEPPKTEATAPVEDEVPAEIQKTPKAAEHWKRLKAAHKTELEAAKARVAEMEAKLKTPQTAENTDAIKRDLEALKKERDDYSERLRMLDVERHPKFKAYYENAVALQVEKAKGIVGPEKAGEIAEILNMPESSWKAARVNELIADLTPYQQTRLGATLDKLADINLEREGEIRKARENFAKVEEQRAAEARAAQETVSTTFDKVVAGLGDDWVTLKARDGDDQWNTEVKERLEYARAIYEGRLPLEDLAKETLKAASVPVLLKAFQAQLDRTRALEEELTALRGASPKPSEGAGTVTDPEEKSSGDFRTDVERRAAGLFAGR